MSNKKTSKQTVENAVIESIEVLKEKHNISDAVFAGMKVYKGWAEGKKVTEKEFLEAKNEFLGAPIDSKKK
ncbi:hypothetical protein [Caloranaerobacter sp. DY30410]|uniref:hypothetical protein n=1 Tax=Caloranaerobacter sp. DY30410 TaxID=3238305 RepID=UPI003CFDF17D